MRGHISNLQFYSTKDGPGIRTTVFCKGCNLDCAWCANPDLIEFQPQLFYYKQRCKACRRCTENKGVTWTDHGILLNRKEIQDPERLVRTCLYNAYEIKGETISSKELVKKLLRDKAFYQVSSGGVTFSGGEPCMQASFIKECARKLHEEGIHVALDTAGCVPWEILQEAAESVDLILYDIKTYDPALHKKCTKQDNRLILENIKKADDLNKEIWVRMVIVPGWNDDLDDIRQRFRLVKKLKHVRRVDVLKYHNLGVSKYVQIGKPYLVDENCFCSEELIGSIQSIADEEGITIHIEN